MFAPFRVGCVAALVTLASVALGSIPASAAGKAFQRAELDEAAIKLEAEIKNDAGQAAKPLAQLRREADAAFQKNDVRNGMVLLGQIIAQAPDESASWLRLVARHPAGSRGPSTAIARRCSSAPAPPPTSPISAPRTATRRPTRCVIVGRSFGDRQVWRPALDALRLSLELREVADVRALYEKMREDHGFRLLDYTVDADSASPRACFQFSEALPGKRTDFSPFVAVAGQDKLALSADDKQLCVEGLEARRALQRDLARRPAVDRQGDAVEVGGPHDLCARPQGHGALRRQGLCAAAHRPARHPAGQRQHQGGRHQRLPHQRPQPDRDRARPRLPAQPLSLRDRAADREPRRQGVERRARRRADAQRRDHHGVSGRSGDRRHGARRLCDDGGGQGHDVRRFRCDVDAVVHRLRHGARGLFRQRRHQRVRQFAGHDRAEGPGRGAADVARQRNPLDQADRRRWPHCLRGRACRAARARFRPPCWSRPMPRATTRFSI